MKNFDFSQIKNNRKCWKYNTYNNKCVDSDNIITSNNNSNRTMVGNEIRQEIRILKYFVDKDNKYKIKKTLDTSLFNFIYDLENVWSKHIEKGDLQILDIDYEIYNNSENNLYNSNKFITKVGKSSLLLVEFSKIIIEIKYESNTDNKDLKWIDTEMRQILNKQLKWTDSFKVNLLCTSDDNKYKKEDYDYFIKEESSSLMSKSNKDKNWSNSLPIDFLTYTLGDEYKFILERDAFYIIINLLNIGISSAYDNDVKLIMEIIKSGHNIEYLNNDKNNNFEGMFKRFKKSLHPKNPLRNFKYIDLRESSLHYLIIKVRDFYRDESGRI